MRIERALQIAKREWGNIRVSLEKGGDIGEFDPRSYATNSVSLVLIKKGMKLYAASCRVSIHTHTHPVSHVTARSKAMKQSKTGKNEEIASLGSGVAIKPVLSGVEGRKEVREPYRSQ